MIYNRIFDVKYNYYGYAPAAYWGLKLPTVEAFIPSVEQVMTAQEFIINRLVLDLNHLDRVYKDLRSKNSLAILRWTKVLWYYISLLLFNKNEFCILLILHQLENMCRLRLHPFCYPFDDSLILDKMLLNFCQHIVKSKF